MFLRKERDCKNLGFLFFATNASLFFSDRILKMEVVLSHQVFPILLGIEFSEQESFGALKKLVLVRNRYNFYCDIEVIKQWAVLCIGDCKISSQITPVKQLLGKDKLKSLIRENKKILRTLQKSCLDLFSNYFVLFLCEEFLQFCKQPKVKKRKKITVMYKNLKSFMYLKINMLKL